jgi:transcriptional regulator with XRE-family HTH domain
MILREPVYDASSKKGENWQMSLDGKDFKLARAHMGLTQQEVADRLRIGLSTYQKWEGCKRKPRPQLRRKVLAFFKDAFYDLGILKDEKSGVTAHEPSSTPPATTSSTTKNRVITFANQNFTSHLFFLVTPPYRGYEDIHHRMKTILKELNAMNSTYQISRREAFTCLVALPIGALRLKTPGQTVKPALYEIALPTCAAGIAGCWELLSKSREPTDLATALDGVSIYLPVLEDIVKYSSQYREKASDLAARCAILKTILSWHCSGNAAATHYAQEALDYSKQSGDISLQLSASSKLAWAYLNEQTEQKRPLALHIALEAKNLLEAARKKHIPIPGVIQSGTYRTLAMMQSMNKQKCDIALGKAGEFDPSEENYAFMLFTPTDVPLETGLIYQNKGDQGNAMVHFQTIVDPQKLTLVSPLVGGERDRVSALNSMTLSVLNGKERDMDEVIRIWTAAIQGATALQSELFFDDAVTTYHVMKYVWPGERRIEDLYPLTVHWSAAEK